MVDGDLVEIDFTPGDLAEGRGVHALDVAEFIGVDLINLDTIIGQDIPRANAYIKSMFVDTIRMVPKAEDGGYYEAQGQVNLTKLMRFTVPVNGVPT